MKKNIVLFLTLIALSVFFLVSCNQPTAMGSIESQVETEEVAQADITEPEIPANDPASDSKATTRWYIKATNYTSRRSGSGPAYGQLWKSVRGQDGSNYYMRAVDADGNATPHVAITSNYEEYSPRLSYRKYLRADRTYYIWVCGFGRNGQENSVHVGLDRRVPNVQFSYGSYLVHSLWDDGRWAYSGTRHTGSNAWIRVLKDGYYDINVWMRENGFRLKEIYISDDKNAGPIVIL